MKIYYNLLIVGGRVADVERFADAAEERRAPLVLEALNLVPKHVVKMNSGLKWKAETWGTATYDELAAVTYGLPNGMRYRVNTEGNPPREWVERVSAENPSLTFALHFLEESSHHSGSLVCTAGSVVASMESSNPAMALSHSSQYFDEELLEDEEEDGEEDDEEMWEDDDYPDDLGDEVREGAE